MVFPMVSPHIFFDAVSGMWGGMLIEALSVGLASERVTKTNSVFRNWF